MDRKEARYIAIYRFRGFARGLRAPPSSPPPQKKRYLRMGKWVMIIINQERDLPVQISKEDIIFHAYVHSHI